MTLLATITVDQVIDALTAFLVPFLPDGCPVIRAQVNRTPPPITPGAADPLAFVRLMEVSQSDLETPTMTQGAVGILSATISTPTQINIQVDFYGTQAWDYCKAVKTVYRSPYAPAQFPDGIKPLYCSDGMFGALVTGEEQYESRVVLTASLQYNPTVIVPQQSATALKLTLLKDLP